jgi:transcriptional regulator with XRE-family HTH domain
VGTTALLALLAVTGFLASSLLTGFDSNKSCALIESTSFRGRSTISSRTRTRLREKIAATAHNQLAGSLLKQGRNDAGGGKPIKQAVYAKKLAASLNVESLARQTLSAWERGTTVVPAAALLASAEVNGVDVGQLEGVRARIADLEAQLLAAVPERSHVDGNGAASKAERLDDGSKRRRPRREPQKPG